MDSNLFELRVLLKKEKYLFSASSPKEKQKWIQMIQDLIKGMVKDESPRLFYYHKYVLEGWGSNCLCRSLSTVYDAEVSKVKEVINPVFDDEEGFF